MGTRRAYFSAPRLHRMVTRLAGRFAGRDTARLVKPLLRVYYSLVFPPLIIRKETTDEGVFNQIFLNGEYDIPLDFTPEFIIDAGANAGYASLWFTACFPNAAIIAVEPEISNFEILKKNCAPYGNIRPVRGAVWYTNCTMTIEDDRVGKWAFRVKEAGPDAHDTIPGISIGEIMKQSGFSRIDILKIDIEGSEKELFLHDYAAWLKYVRVLIIELHEKAKPGCSAVFHSAVSAYPFRKFTSGENIVLIRQTALHLN